MMISRYNMRIKNNDKTYFRAVCIVLFSLAFTGCTKDGLNADNVRKWGTGNVVVTTCEPHAVCDCEAWFDVVAVDAPCSGEGMFRKDPAARGEWSENNVRQLPEFPMARQNYTISGFSSLMRMVP